MAVDISFQNFLKAFWEFRFDGLGESKSMPIDFPLWYVRDLMIIILCSPLLNIFIKLKSPFIVLLGILWLTFNINFYGIEVAGFFFFTLGGYWAVYKIDLISFLESRISVILITFIFVICIILDFMNRDEAFYNLLHNIVILIGMIFIIMCMIILVKKEKIRNALIKVAPSTFFIYALHGLFVATLRKGLCEIISPSSNIAVICIYILSLILTVILSMTCYYVTKRICPKVCVLLNGGRC